MAASRHAPALATLSSAKSFSVVAGALLLCDAYTGSGSMDDAAALVCR
jgi:hypothetical protein